MHLRVDPNLPVLARFWLRVCISDPLECWIWTGTGADSRKKPYGWFKHQGKIIIAHRFAYELLIGSIPDGLQLDHLCRNHRCVNPDHLEPVTCRENVLRGVGPTAENARKTHCRHGHLFDETNIYPQEGKWRGCRKCRYQAGMRWKERQNNQSTLMEV